MVITFELKYNATTTICNEPKELALKAQRHKLTRHLALALAGTIASVSALFATATPASASSTHCAWIGPKVINNIRFPEGQYCFSVNGSGLYVNNTLSSYWSGWTENLSERVDAVDMYGNTYGSWWTYRGYGTLYGTHSWTAWFHSNMRPGSLCGHLFTNGVQVGVVCNGIHS